MYNTIENPDVKMAKELANQKIILEVSSDKTLGMLEDLSVDIKTSIKELEQLSNKKIDNNNVKDLNEKSNDINYEIVNNLLEKFYGKMKVSNNKGKIAITLCVNQRLLTEYEVVSNREENKDIKIKYSDFNGKRILIVDDNKLNIREMKSLLKPYNVEVVVVNSPYEMSKLLNSNVTFDLIFIDDMISSFGINDFTNEIKEIGNNILNYIKKDAKYPITTIIMVTANKGKEEEKYLKYGFSDYIIKPISKGMLDKILRKYFNK